MLGPAQPDPLGAEAVGAGGVLAACRRSRARRAARSSSDQRRTVSKRSSTCASTSGTSSVVIVPVRAVDRDEVAAVQDELADPHLARVQVDLQLGGARDRRTAHPARDQRRVRGLAALGGEDPDGGVEARDVVGLGERPHEDHRLPVSAACDGLLGAVNTIVPLAAPGEAATPRASTV